MHPKIPIQDDAILRDLYGKVPTRDLAEWFGKSSRAIHVWASKRGVRMSREERMRWNPPPKPAPDGTVRINKNKDRHRRPRREYQVKVAGRWRTLARRIWEEHHGAIPKGGVITFKDENTLNVALDNLVLVRRSDILWRARLADRAIARSLAVSHKGGTFKVDRSLYEEFMKHPELLNAKRSQIQLNRTLKEKESV